MGALASDSSNDPLLISNAQDFFFAGRLPVLQVGAGNSEVLSQRFSADWLATQLYESRLVHFEGGRLAAVTPWDDALYNGFPATYGSLGLSGTRPSRSFDGRCWWPPMRP